MQIIDNRKFVSITFGDLKPGDVFIYNDRTYLKLNDDKTDNTFNLNTNTVVVSKSEDMPVTLVDATLMIE